MDFQTAEAQFRQLDQQYRRGAISLEQYRAALGGLRVTDAHGRTWQMQEKSGQWHVYQDNRWVPATPAGRSQTPAPPAARRRPKRGGSGRVLLFGLGGLGLMGVCLLGGLAAWYFFLRTPGTTPGGGTTAQEGEAANAQATEQAQAAEMLILEPGETLTAAPGAVQTDPNGVSLGVPADALAGGQMAALTAFQADGTLGEALGDSLSTPFYSAAAQGDADGVGRAELSFPAPSPDARILTVIDGAYMAVLDVAPENGKLVINPRLAPQGSAVPADALDPGKVGQPGTAQSVHYAVITPKQASGAAGHMAIPAQEVDPRDCTVPGYDGMALSLCRKNPEGSVYLEYFFTLALTKEQADRTVDEIAAAMQRYADLGFTAANISASNSVHVVVMQSGDPEYSFKTGVIYLPLDAAQSTSQARRFEIYHEMAHWIQDEEYVMLFAGASGAGRWWMETSAENMVMLLDEAAIARNLSTYGTITGNAPLTALQSSPYQWPSDFYAHAQLVKVNMCSSGACPISQQSFVEAINKGSYPFDDGGAQAKLNANLDDYARYLLGAAPQQANSAIPLTGPVQSGAGYGEEMNVMKTTKTDFHITYDGAPPQMQDAEANGMPAAAVQARIQKDGVYPLRVTSGRDGRYPGLPAALKIAPGAPFYYRVDGGGVQYSDGSAEVVLQPIHQTMGLKDVRIVALGRSGGEVFSAQLETISLEGTWLFKPESVVSNSVACNGETGSDGDPSAFGFILIGIGSAIGEYTPDASGAGLTWGLVPARLPPDTDTSDFTYNGSVTLTPDEIKLQAGIDIPRQESSRAPGWGIALAGGLLPVGLVLARRKRLPPYTALVVLLVCTLTLSACFDLKIYGDTTSEMTFSKLEYMGGEEAAVYGIEAYPATTPLWQLSGGQATYAVNFTIEVTTEDEEGNEVTEIETCSGTAVYGMSAGVFKDVIVQTEGE